MRTYFELQPSRFRQKIESQLEALSGLTERVHIPDAPLGYPKASTLAISSIALQRGFKTTIHLRTLDYSLVGFLNQLYGAYIIGVDRILFLRGDPPYRGSVVRDITSEEALRLLKEDERLRGIEGGLIVSLRFSIEDILSRLSLEPDFILVTHKTRDKLEKIRERYRGEVIGYVILKTESNAEYVERLPQKEDICPIELVRECVEAYRDIIDSVLLSCPMDTIFCLHKLKKLGESDLFDRL